jgi:hypothetical protein
VSNSLGDVTEVEIRADDQRDPMQLENPVEETGDNTLTTNHMATDMLVAKQIEAQDPIVEDSHQADNDGDIVLPEIIVNKPCPEHVLDIEDNERLNGSTEASTSP